jgi:DNA-binding IclR family transcriptional regulator
VSQGEGLATRSSLSAKSDPAPALSPTVKVNSVANALAVLRRLATADRPEGVNAIARAIGINPSSCFNILKTLASEDFAQFDAVEKTYTLGAGAVDLAVAALDPEAGFLRTRPILETVARDFDVSCGLWRRSGDRMSLLGAAENQTIARIRFTPGQRLPLMSGAMGRCAAARAEVPQDELATAIANLRWHAPPKLDRYLSEVRAAGVNGYALDDGDFLLGITSVAAPVISREGALTHCIVASTFKGRFDREGLRELGRAVRHAADLAAPRLGAMR